MTKNEFIYKCLELDKFARENLSKSNKKRNAAQYSDDYSNFFIKAAAQEIKILPATYIKNWDNFKESFMTTIIDDTIHYMVPLHPLTNE